MFDQISSAIKEKYPNFSKNDISNIIKEEELLQQKEVQTRKSRLHL